MTVLELLQSNDKEGLEDLKRLRKNIKPSNSIGNNVSKDITDRSYKDVMECNEMYHQGKILELTCYLLDIKDDYLLNQDWKEFIYFGVWIDRQFEDLKRLNDILNADNDKELEMKMEEAGAESLNMFSHLNVMDDLANGDILKWYEVEKLPYMTVWTKLLMNKKKAKVQKKLAQINAAEAESRAKAKSKRNL